MCLNLDRAVSYPWSNETRVPIVSRIEFVAIAQNADDSPIILDVSAPGNSVPVLLYSMPGFPNRYRGVMKPPTDAKQCLELSIQRNSDIEIQDLFIQVEYYFRTSCSGQR
jgi:hypothetical protein